MIACYIRVSTTSQDSDCQKKDIRRWLKGQAIATKDVRWFEDKETGKHTDRPAFKKMQEGVYPTNGDRRRGYRKAKDKVLKLHEKGHSPTAIARECGIARSTVYSYLDESS